MSFSNVPAWDYVITKTFNVLNTDWQTATIDEELSVEGMPALPHRMPEFQNFRSASFTLRLCWV